MLEVEFSQFLVKQLVKILARTLLRVQITTGRVEVLIMAVTFHNTDVYRTFCEGHVYMLQ